MPLVDHEPDRAPEALVDVDTLISALNHAGDDVLAEDARGGLLEEVVAGIDEYQLPVLHLLEHVEGAVRGAEHAPECGDAQEGEKPLGDRFACDIEALGKEVALEKALVQGV